MSRSGDHPARGRRHRRLWGALLAAVLGAVVVVPAAAPSATAEEADVVVSLTFDDGRDNHLAAAELLTRLGVTGTFYVSSGLIDTQTYLTRAELQKVADLGHEIGGHTAHHFNLAEISPEEARRQICDDRATLVGWGFAARSFSYPYSSSTPDAEAATRECGYLSSRHLGDLRTRWGCDPCAYAETLPPVDPWNTRAIAQVDETWTFEDFESGVLNAESTGGGWVQYTFHDVCASGCSDLNVTPVLLTQFIEWLKARPNVVLRTVGEAIGGEPLPGVPGPVVAAPAPGANAIINASLENRVSADATIPPQCWTTGGWGDREATFALDAPAHSGEVALAITIDNYVSGDAKALPRFDLGECAPSVTPGRSYSLRSWYTSTQLTQFAVYLRNDAGAWSYWTTSRYFRASDIWHQAAWESPPVPAGSTAISFGLALAADGHLRVDDVALYDTVGAPSLVPPDRVGHASRTALQKGVVRTPQSEREAASSR